MRRHCSRTGCSESAEATLSYQYAQAQVWIDVLSSERDPHQYDLCGRHAARLTAPNGWQVIDRRAAEQAEVAAAAAAAVASTAIALIAV